MASARQIALRTHLRNHYWLNSCQDITDETVQRFRKRMAMVDPQDTMADPQVEEVLTPFYGFERTAEGWAIPELKRAQEDVVHALAAKKARMSALGIRSGQARAAKAQAKSGDGRRSPLTVQDLAITSAAPEVPLEEPLDF